MNTTRSSDWKLYRTMHKTHSTPCPCWTEPYIFACACTCLSLPACWSGLAQSVIQVRPTGSGLMRIGSALSGSRPGVEAVCGAQGEKRNAVEHTSSPSLETGRDAAKCSENSDLSRHNDTQCSEFLWGAVGQSFLKTHKPLKGIKALIQGVRSALPFFLVYRKQPLFLSSHKQGSSPWQTCPKVMLMPPRLFKLW